MSMQSEFINTSIDVQSWWSTGCPSTQYICLADWLPAGQSNSLSGSKKCNCVRFAMCVCVCEGEHRCVCGGKEKQGKGVCFLLVWVCIWMRMTLHYWWVPQVIWEQLAVRTRTNILRENGAALLQTHIYMLSPTQRVRSKTEPYWEHFKDEARRLQTNRRFRKVCESQY